MTKRYSRRQFLEYGVLAGGALTLVACSPSEDDGTADAQGTTSAGTGDGPTTTGGEGPPGIEGGEVVTDPSAFPSQFSERPEFAEMVAAGTLPPVAERIGQDPLVIRPVHDIGKYGGTMRRAYIGVGDFQNANNFCAGPDGLLYWEFRRETVVPNIARDFELSDDGTELMIHLRRGMHWSDGQPFTADDIVFWRNDINLNPDVSSGAQSLRPGGQNTVVEKIDEFTVRYASPVPHPLLPALLASTRDIGGLSTGGMFGDGGYAPKHYLSQFLPAYTSLDQANKLAADAGLEGWSALLKNRASWHLNPELPVLGPWMVTRGINDPPWEFTANPYSVWVDTEGNQLPYINTITMSNVEQTEVVILRATAGELDVQDRHLVVSSLPVLIENEERAGCKLHRTVGEELDFGLRINLAYDKDPVIGELIRTTDFRRALGLGIDRDEINEAFFLGTSTPTATVGLESSPYFPGEEWRTKWATLDVAQANELLDGIGLTAKDGAGFRLRPDGGDRIRLTYEATQGFADFVGIGEMIKGQWQAIGIDMTVQQVDGNLLIERAVANEIVLSGHTVGTSDPFLRPDSFLPVVTNNYPGLIGIPYAQWFLSGGAQGTEPPPSMAKVKEALELYRQGLQAPDDERAEIGKQLYMMHVDEVWSIGVVGFGVAINGMYYAKSTLRNVPESAFNSLHMKTPANLLAQTFYYE